MLTEHSAGIEVTWNSHSPRGLRKCLLQICHEKFLGILGLEGTLVVVLCRVFLLPMRSREGKAFCCKVAQTTGEVEVKGRLSKAGLRSRAGFLVAKRLS